MAENQTEMPNPLDGTPEGIQRFKTWALEYLGLSEYDKYFASPQECPEDAEVAGASVAQPHQGTDAQRC